MLQLSQRALSILDSKEYYEDRLVSGSNHYYAIMGSTLITVELQNLGLVKPPIKNTPKEDKPPNKGQAKSTHVYTLYRKSPLKEDNLSTKDKMAGPEGVLY